MTWLSRLRMGADAFIPVPTRVGTDTLDDARSREGRKAAERRVPTRERGNEENE